MWLQGFSQPIDNTFQFWRLARISGQANVRANYREYESIFSESVSKHDERFLNGLLQLRTQSFFIHPNFMVLDLNGTYNPESARSNFIGEPGTSESSHNQGFDASAIFFRKKNFNLTTSLSKYSSIHYADNITSVKANSQYAGAQFNYNNKVLPFSLNYSRQYTNEKTLDDNRTFNMNQKLFQAMANKSFGIYDHHSVSYLHSENSSSQNDVGYSAPVNAFNKADYYELSDDITFGRRKDFTYSSSLSRSDQRGTNLFKTLAASENFSVRLPASFFLTNSYNYRRTEQEFNTRINFNRIQSILSHQLYSSLVSKLTFEHSVSDQQSYNEKRDRGGIELRYHKEITNGKLIIQYDYYKEKQTITTPPAVLNILHEGYMLVDNQITLIRNAYVNIQTVVVKDNTGTIIYQLNTDYLLVNRYPYIEIIRVPGGMIANNATVYIDYMVERPGNYEYNANNHSLSTDIWQFKNKLNVYYRLNVQDFNNKYNTESVALNIYTRHVVGFRLDFYYLKGGMEYEYYNSNLIPFKGLRYYVTYQKMYKKFNFLLNANLSDYQMTDEGSRRQEMDASSKVSYQMLPNLRLDWDYMYRNMTGAGIDMNVHTTKLEITTTLHKLFLTVGSDYYWSQTKNSKLKFKGVHIQLARYF